MRGSGGGAEAGRGSGREGAGIPRRILGTERVVQALMDAAYKATRPMLVSNARPELLHTEYRDGRWSTVWEQNLFFFV